MDSEISSLDTILLPLDSTHEPLDAAPPLRSAPPRIDGLFDDWNPEDLLIRDPQGDAEGPFDLLEFWVQSRGTQIFLRFEIAGELNLNSGPAEDGEMFILVELPNAQILRVDFRGQELAIGGWWYRWPQLAFFTAPTHASSAFEMRLDLAFLGVEQGESVRLQVSGADSLEEWIPFILEEEPWEPSLRSATPPPESQLRLATLNTHENGLQRPEAAGIHRQIQAVAADIYCFQEEYRNSSGSLGLLLNNLTPGDEWWYVEKKRDLAIGSRASLSRLPDRNARFLAAIVHLEAGPVLVFNYHGSCCGWRGSEEDQNRSQELQEMAELIQDFRGAELGQGFAAFSEIPILVTGDFNLVGGSTPMDLLRAPEGPDLSWWMPSHLRGEDPWTWRRSTARIGPGILDLMLFSAENLEPLQGFVLDTADLDAPSLVAMGLQQADSLASDHLMVVFDFALP